MRLTARVWKRLAGDHRGAVTTDMVVLTGGAVFLGIAAAWGIMGTGVSRTVDKVTAGVAGAAQPDVGGQSDASSQGNGTATSVEETAEAPAEGQDAADDAASGKSNNGNSDAAHDNPGKRLAKGAAK